MNIRLAYDFNFEEFKTLFPEIKLYDYNDFEPIDLLVFPGGEDVSGEYYLPLGDFEEYKHLIGNNKHRDEKEKALLEMALTDYIKVNKILGICRGAQFLNVMMGGTLYPDMGIYGIKHGNYHEITHVKRSNLGFFNVVNSLHHQGIRILGQRRRENYENTKGVAIATDLTHDVVEIATWLDDKILALQFHPEYYDDNNEDKIKLRQFIYDWVKGKTTILTK